MSNTQHTTLGLTQTQVDALVKAYGRHIVTDMAAMQRNLVPSEWEAARRQALEVAKA